MILQPSALLFDMDGVLVDSLDSWWQALNHALRTFERPEISRDEFIKNYWGHDLYDNLERMKLDEEIGLFCNTTYGDHLDAIKIYPDTTATLRHLSPYKKGVITNTPKDCAWQILERFSIKGYFKTVVTSDEVSKAKPSPEIVYKACDILEVNPHDVVMIGDTISDVKAGRAAGCTVIGVGIDADYRIERLAGLNDILKV